MQKIGHINATVLFGRQKVTKWPQNLTVVLLSSKMSAVFIAECLALHKLSGSVQQCLWAT